MASDNKSEGEAGLAAAHGSALPTSATHRICVTCQYRWRSGTAPEGDLHSWCYMFRDASHLDSKGYCGQWLASAPNISSKQ